MAKIDTGTIPGFEEMSAEDKLNALLGYEFETPKPDNSEVERLKSSLSKANSEAAEWKRALREKQTEAEREAAERAEKEAEKDRLIEKYEAERRIDHYTKKFVEVGYDLDTATTMANALPPGVKDEYFAASKNFMETKTKEIESAALSKQPGLSVGTPPTTQTAEKDRMNELRKYAGLPPIK